VEVFTKTFPVELIHVDASEKFFNDLKGVNRAEAKRKIIGRDFVEVFKEESVKLGKRDHFRAGHHLPRRPSNPVTPRAAR
jgi:GMP synthase (glutamine-hydrolysing)